MGRLIECSTCGNNVSINAYECPSCGETEFNLIEKKYMDIVGVEHHHGHKEDYRYYKLILENGSYFIKDYFDCQSHNSLFEKFQQYIYDTTDGYKPLVGKIFTEYNPNTRKITLFRNTLEIY